MQILNLNPTHALNGDI